MIKLTQCSETFGDCTALYSVEMDKPYTVGEFIEETVARKGDWGYIGIADDDYIFGNPVCEYKWGKIIAEMSVEVLNQVVIKAKASGGWSRMDYTLYI